MVRFGFVFLLAFAMLLMSCAPADVQDEDEATVEQDMVADNETAPSLTSTSGSMPTVVFFNGQVITMDPNLPKAEALAVLGEDILAIGTNEEIQALSGSETRVIDLGGKTILPGFVDPHTHTLTYGGLTLEEAQQITLEGGTTTVGAAAISPDRLNNLMQQLESTKLRIRTSLYLTYNLKCSPLDGTWLLEYPPMLDTNEMIRFPGIKIFGDKGYMACGLGAMSVELPPELVAERGGGPYGDLILSLEEMTQVIAKHQALGYQVIIHATGDRTVETALDAIEAALAGKPNTFRHRIEHNDFVRPELLSRYGEIGIVPIIRGRSWSPVCSLNENDGVHWFGESVHPWFYLHRSLLDANPGLPIAWHSDGASTTKHPIRDLYFLVTRKEISGDGVTACEPPDWFVAEAITVEEALRLMTINAAYALFIDEKVGSLMPGKFADLIILSDNPLTVDPDSLIDLAVLMTMVGGRVEYCQVGYETLCP